MRSQFKSRLLCCLLLLAGVSKPQIQPGFYWNGVRQIPPTKVELDEIVRAHQTWINSNGQQGSRANLSHRDLTNLDIEGVNLCGADFDGAALAGANLSKSVFGLDEQEVVRIARMKHLPPPPMNLTVTIRDEQGRITYQSRPVPGTTNMQGSNLSSATLVQTDLSFSNLAKANLSLANLNGADLSNADLTGANLSKAKLDGASLGNANFEDTIFEPTSIVGISGIESATNLEHITYEANPDALIKVRNLFGEEGLTEQQRRISYAINKRQAQLLPFLYRWIQFVAFDLTCEYGMRPERPLWLIVLIWAIFTLIYAVSLHKNRRSFRVKLTRSNGTHEKNREFPMWPPPEQMDSVQKTIKIWMKFERRILCAMMFFGMVNAFDFGFGEFPIGQMLRKLTRRQYEIKVSGWPRYFAGVQSIVSVLLFALWIRLRTGHPFE